MPHFLDQASVATDAAADPSIGIVQVGQFAPTAEQVAITRAVLDSDENIMIDALAGAAKTSTLVLIANQPAMQEISTLCIAFNKKIADEMKNRLPPNCFSSTMHSLGMRTWGQSIGRRTNVDARKGFRIMKGLIEDQRKDIRDQLFEVMADLMNAVSWGKTCGWVPDACERRKEKRLIHDEEFFNHLPEQLQPIEEQIVTKALLLSIEEAYAGIIDFDDMPYMPTVFPSRFPKYPLTMVDETQDLSALNHSMVEQIVRDKRLIAVGDPFQAIYGFRGAHQDSMDLMQHRFRMRRLNLTCTFRCPKLIADEARWRAPHINSPDWAKDGEVRRLPKWSVEDLPANAVIICRNNAPLFKTAIRLLIDGRFPEIVGRDLSKTLTKALKSLGSDDLPASEVYLAIDDYEIKKLSRAREHAKGGIRDLCECLRAFVSHGETLKDIIAYAEYICNSEGPIKLMTGHKSKGLEFHECFILDQHLCRTDKDDQEKNLLYVMQTRSMARLTYIKSEDFQPLNLTGEE